jgi:hypothetical protein
MFHLEPRVHFHKVKVLTLNNEFDGSGSSVLDGLGSIHSRSPNLPPCLGSEAKGRGFFDDLLMASLDGTVSFPQVDTVPVRVTKNLNFDVAGGFNESER